jgi:hypothetical protein
MAWSTYSRHMLRRRAKRVRAELRREGFLYVRVVEYDRGPWRWRVEVDTAPSKQHESDYRRPGKI